MRHFVGIVAFAGFIFSAIGAITALLEHNYLAALWATNSTLWSFCTWLGAKGTYDDCLR